MLRSGKDIKQTIVIHYDTAVVFIILAIKKRTRNIWTLSRSFQLLKKSS